MEELEQKPPYDRVDEVTRARVGSLAAHGLTDQQIADVLLLTKEAVEACHHSPEFKSKYAEVADEAIKKQIMLDEGWDAIEDQALAQILETLEYNRDPKYALFAAKTANAANRRVRKDKVPAVIDATQKQSNVIVLNMNKTFINRVTENNNKDAIDVTPRQIENQPRKRVDLPSPSQVENLLAPVRALGKDKVLSELEQAFEIAGVFKDDDTL